MEFSDKLGKWKRRFPTKDKEREAIEKWAPGMDLSNLWKARETAIQNWSEPDAPLDEPSYDREEERRVILEHINSRFGEG